MLDIERSNHVQGGRPPTTQRNAKPVSPYHQFKDDVRAGRVVVPHSAVIELLHKGHPRNNLHEESDQSFVWWPGIDHDIEKRIQSCEACDRHNPAPVPFLSSQMHHGSAYMQVLLDLFRSYLFAGDPHTLNG